jgi:hypothetical protein
MVCARLALEHDHSVLYPVFYQTVFEKLVSTSLESRNLETKFASFGLVFQML